MPIAADALAAADRIAERPAENDSHILDRVVVIDLVVSIRANREIDERMAGKLVQHMVEERYAGRCIASTPAIEIEFDPDRGLAGLPLADSLPHRRSPLLGRH